MTSSVAFAGGVSQVCRKCFGFVDLIVRIGVAGKRLTSRCAWTSSACTSCLEDPACTALSCICFATESASCSSDSSQSASPVWVPTAYSLQPSGIAKGADQELTALERCRQASGVGVMASKASQSLPKACRPKGDWGARQQRAPPTNGEL